MTRQKVSEVQEALLLREDRDMIGVAFNITECKESEQERLQLSGHLINAQEQERKPLPLRAIDQDAERVVAGRRERQVP